jgi:NADPH-dependent curcumin reductase CurA
MAVSQAVSPAASPAVSQAASPAATLAASERTGGATTRTVVLARRPDGRLLAEDLRIESRPLPDLEPGQALVRNELMSLDPSTRGRMDAGDKVYTTNFSLGQALDGWAIGHVVESRSAALPVGSTVRHRLGWRELAVLDAGSARVVDLALAPATSWLSALGQTGFTAYVGLTRIGDLAVGDTVFVSAAAGGVGSIGGQLARLLGAGRVIGSAGGIQKCRWLIEDVGFDAAIDYRSQDLSARLAELAADGLDLYFDNVGGDHLVAALHHLRVGGRVTLCGMVSTMQDGPNPAAISELIEAVLRRVTLRGFIVRDHEDLRPEFETKVANWLDSGQLRDHSTVVDGLESAPAAMVGLLEGGNLGKALVRLGQAPS